MRYNTENVIERGRELVTAKVPFLHQGRDFNGIDCVGALVYAYEFDGDVPPYPENPINGELEINLENVFGDPLLVVNKLQPMTTYGPLRALDILSMQYRGPIRHVGFVVPHVCIAGALSIIHTDAAVGRVTEHILDPKWLRRIVKVWRP